MEEGAQKGSTTGGFTSVKSTPKKAQVTLRFNQEVQWADEDYQLGILSELATAGSKALSRGLDLGLYHRINPLTGTVISSWSNYLNATTKRVEITASSEADQDIRAAVGLLVNSPTNWGVNGIALDPKMAWALANLQSKNADGSPSGVQRYPNLGFGTNVTDFLGVPAATGNTVSGTPEAADTKLRAIVGDFQNGIRWGVQRELPVELIRYGDPDGQGDLMRNNQIALRLEIVYGWYVFTDRFAVVEDKVTP
ncbi:major capsid protein [Arthrobacter woluwensis]|uniref:major capsid protein n=1 Tax=Arthrobacter woluwensis TaxID=156980 RepID=UPI001C31C20A|nr:major capsid protein [Arthrobacter woluwensis]